jgi:hypothetical protein
MLNVDNGHGLWHEHTGISMNTYTDSIDIDMDMRHGHGNAACTETCSMEMYINAAWRCTSCLEM